MEVLIDEIIPEGTPITIPEEIPLSKLDAELLIKESRETDEKCPLYEPPEDRLSWKELINHHMKNDPRCPLFNETEFVNSDRFGKEIKDTYELKKFDAEIKENGHLLQKKDRLKLKLQKRLVERRLRIDVKKGIKKEELKKPDIKYTNKDIEKQLDEIFAKFKF